MKSNELMAHLEEGQTQLLACIGSSAMYKEEGVTEASMKEAVNCVNSIKRMVRDINKGLGYKSAEIVECKFDKDRMPAPVTTRLMESKESTIARVISEVNAVKLTLDNLASKEPSVVRVYQNIVGPMNKKIKLTAAFNKNRKAAAESLDVFSKALAKAEKKVVSSAK